MMTDKKAPNKRKIIDWDKKSATDSDRLLTRSKEKEEPKNKTRPPRATGKALTRLRKKIQEIYEEDDYEDQDDIINTPLYHVELINDIEQFEKRETELIKISKQQELSFKLNIIMNSALAAQKVGLDAEINNKDMQLADNPELAAKEVRKKSVKEKITKPLDIQEETDFIADEMDAKKLAKLVLEKTGRSKKKSKKSLADIAHGLNRIKEYADDSSDETPKE